MPPYVKKEPALNELFHRKKTMRNN